MSFRLPHRRRDTETGHEDGMTLPEALRAYVPEHPDGKHAAGVPRGTARRTARPKFTAHPAALTRPMQAVRDPAPPRPARPLIFEAMGGVTLLPCAYCGTEYTDPDAESFDRMLGQMRRTARDAGWGTSPYGHWCCPGCLPPRNLPVLAGGVQAEVTLMISARIAAGVYEDVGAVIAEIAEREERIRIAEDAAAELDGSLLIGRAA